MLNAVIPTMSQNNSSGSAKHYKHRRVDALSSDEDVWQGFVVIALAEKTTHYL